MTAAAGAWQSARRAWRYAARVGLFLGARAGPASVTLLLAVVYGLSDRPSDYLLFSAGFALAALLQNLVVGWWTHWLVRTDPADHCTAAALAGFNQVLFGLVFVLGVVSGASLFLALGQPSLVVAVGSAAVGLCSLQMALGATVMARLQHSFSHRQLLVAESSRAGFGLLGAIAVVVTAGSGTLSLLAMSVGAIAAIVWFAWRVIPGRGGGIVGADRSRTSLAFVRRDGVRYGLPIVGVNVAFLVIQFSDRVILSLLGNTDEAGEYAGAYDLINRPVGLALAAVSLASQRLVFARYDAAGDDDGSGINRRDLLVQLAVAAFACAALIVIAGSSARARSLIIGELDVLVPVLAFASAVLLGLSHTLMRPLQAANETGRIGRYAALAAISNLALNLALIPGLGPTGAAIATVMSVGLFVVTLLSRKPQEQTAGLA